MIAHADDSPKNFVNTGKILHSLGEVEPYIVGEFEPRIVGRGVRLKPRLPAIERIVPPNLPEVEASGRGIRGDVLVSPLMRPSVRSNGSFRSQQYLRRHIGAHAVSASDDDRPLSPVASSRVFRLSSSKLLRLEALRAIAHFTVCSTPIASMANTRSALESRTIVAFQSSPIR